MTLYIQQLFFFFPESITWIHLAATSNVPIHHKKNRAINAVSYVLKPSTLSSVAWWNWGHSQFHWRRQSQEGRISTVEAAALVMEELMDESDRGDTLRKSLAVLMDALGRQCHHASWKKKP